MERKGFHTNVYHSPPPHAPIVIVFSTTLLCPCSPHTVWLCFSLYAALKLPLHPLSSIVSSFLCASIVVVLVKATASLLSECDVHCLLFPNISHFPRFFSLSHVNITYTNIHSTCSFIFTFTADDFSPGSKLEDGEQQMKVQLNREWNAKTH